MHLHGSARARQLGWTVRRESDGRRGGGDERTGWVSFERVIKVRRELGQTKACCSRDCVRSLSPVSGVNDLAPTYLAAFLSTENNAWKMSKRAITPKPSFYQQSGNKLGTFQSRRIGKSSRLFLLLGKNNSHEAAIREKDKENEKVPTQGGGKDHGATA